MFNKKGQSLLIVVVTMTIALAIGVALSLRVLSTLSRSTKTDTSSRVQAAAEGGAENYLVKTPQELQDLSSVCIGGYGGSVPPECQVDFSTLAAGDNISADSAITVQPYGEGSDELPLEVDAGEVVEVNLQGFTGDALLVCWSEETVLQYTEYSDTDIEKNVVDCRSCTHGMTLTSVASSDSGSSHGQAQYNQCYRVANISGDLQGLRVRSLGGPASFGIVPENGDLPIQGYEITSEAELTDLDTEEQVEKTVKVRKSLPYFPGVFDYSIYSDTGVLD